MAKEDTNSEAHQLYPTSKTALYCHKIECSVLWFSDVVAYLLQLL